MSRFWAITTFFGTGDRRRRLENYDLFRAHSKAQGLRLITVELTYPGQGPLVTPDRAEIVIQRSAHSILWHKESLLNLALTALPDRCEFVAWLDSDLVFCKADWIKSAIHLLERHKVVQLFTEVYRSPVSFDLEATLRDDFPWAEVPLSYNRDEGCRLYSLAHVHQNRPYRTFTPGYAWASHREILQEIGFLDYCIVGGADMVIAEAFLGTRLRGTFYDIVPSYEEIFRDYEAKIARVVSDSLVANPGRIIHLNHGNYASRRYEERGKSLLRYQFDPRVDLKRVDGVWEWAVDKPDLIRDVEWYFRSREEAES